MQHVQNLTSDDPSVRDAAVDAILASRNTVIEELISLLLPAPRTGGNTDVSACAAYLLGEFRAAEAVPALSNAMMLDQDTRFIADISRYDTPYFNALVKIGRPSVPAMIENVRTSDDGRLRQNSLLVLAHVLGGKHRVLELLAMLQEMESDAEVEARGHYRRVPGQRQDHPRVSDPEALQRLQVAAQWVSQHFNEREKPLF
ncbi:MAG: hypothetical protein KF724_02175 [Phycisphaeraceae bacterium]|nr:hypothetical protein [Phycisphaeraceae bacterium]